jgi:hypothetical protein
MVTPAAVPEPDPTRSAYLFECAACDLFPDQSWPLAVAEQMVGEHDHQHHQGDVTARVARF